MNRFFCFLIFCLTGSSLEAQTIEGTIFHGNEVVSFASVIIRNPDNINSVYQFTKTNKEGFYQIQLKGPLDSVWVEVNAIAFESQKKHLKDIQKHKQPVIVNFNLDNKITELEEVVIIKESPIKVKNDTITYNPDSFKDGTERVVEDLLKKLPGIKVEENGEIKFNGRSIKKFLLDGDDLFGSQYTIGSKNISVEMIDKVQAIQDFNENAMLKGLVNSEDVAINLQLKKGKTDLSGDAFVSYGIQNRYSASVTGLLINKKAKGFLTTGYNNVGSNSSPYDFSSEITSFSQDDEKKLLASELINQGEFYSQLDNKYHRVNSNFYSSFNLLHKFSQKIAVKLNLGIYDDKLTRNNISYSEFYTDNQKITINETENIIKKPRLYNVVLQLSNKANDSLSWEYNGKTNYQDVNFNSRSNNNNIFQKNKVSTINFYTNQNFNITNRVNKNSAVTGYALYTINRAPQNFSLTPGLNIEDNNTDYVISNNQYGRFDKKVFKVKSEYYHSFNDMKLKVMAGYSSVNNTLNSNLNFNYADGISYSDTIFKNNMYYKYQLPNIAVSFSYLKKQKYGFGLLFNTQYYDIALNDKIRNIEKKDQNLIFSPIIKFLYVLNSKSSLSATYSYNEVLPSEDNLFEGIVLTRYRNFRNNTPDITFLNTHSYNLNYGYNDVFKITRFSLSLTHNNSNNNYFSRSIINLENTFTNSFLLGVGNKDYNLNLDAERYIHFMKTTMQINSSYTLSYDKNIINNSDLRDVKTKLLFLNCVLRTGFKLKFNVENKLSYFNNDFFLDGVSQNQFSSLTNSLKLIYKIGYEFKADATFNLISPDLSKNNNYLFLDSQIRYTPQKKTIQYALIISNLTNNTKFETISISDYSKTISSHNLLERYILGSVSFRF